jgi:hypothetical protein
MEYKDSKTIARDGRSPRAVKKTAQTPLHKRSPPNGKKSDPVQVSFRPIVSADVVVVKVAGCIACIFDFLNQYGLVESESTSRSYIKSVDYWVAQVRAMSGDWIGYAKYRLAAFVFFSTIQLGPGPVVPAGVKPETTLNLLSGVVNRFLLKMLKSAQRTGFSTRLQLELISGIGLGVKKGMPRPDKPYLTRGATKAFVALTTVRVQPPTIESLEEIIHPEWADRRHDDHARYEQVVSRATARLQVDRICHELFSGTDYLTWKGTQATRPFPSTSSTNSHSIKEGGGISDIRDFIKEEGLEALGLADLHFQPVHERAFAELVNMELGGNDEDLIDVDAYTMDPTAVTAAYDELYEALRLGYVASQYDPEAKVGRWNNDVDIVMLAEALKVRGITKGNGLRNFLLAPLQKFMHGRMKVHPVFSLIGQTLTESHVHQILGRELKRDEAYLSGDYSAATDNLAPWLSEMIAESITRQANLPPWMFQLFMEALTMHNIRNPDVKGESKMQAWGQLMGSVVSFPVLCIANAVVCRWTIECAKGRRVGLKDLKVLINGDDCVFRLPIRALPVWERIAAFHGLSPSIGKFFLSKQIIQMNSRNFIREPTTHVCIVESKRGAYATVTPFRELRFVNMGLFYGFGRSMLMDANKENKEEKQKTAVSVRYTLDLEGILNMSSRAHDMLTLCPLEMQERLFHNYLEYHKPAMTHHASLVSWFTPKRFGGLGLPIFRYGPHLEEDPEGFGEFNMLLTKGEIFLRRTTLSKSFHPNVLDRRVIGGLLEHSVAPPALEADKAFPLRRLAGTLFPCKRVLSVTEYDSEIISAFVCLKVVMSVDLLPEVKEGVLAKSFLRLGYWWKSETKKKRKVEQPVSVLALLATSANPQYPVFNLHQRIRPARIPFADEVPLGFEERRPDQLPELW